MRLSSPSSLLALLAITILADALPFTPKLRSNRPLARREATYSVVPVDGGSTSAAAATTVVESKTLPPVTQTELSTLVSTVIVTQYESPATVVVTVTEMPSLPPPQTTPASALTSLPESTPAPSYPEITTTTTTTTSAWAEYTLITTTTTFCTGPPTTTSVITPSAFIRVTTLPLEVITVTASPSSTPYDDGMWHTTYYHPAY